MNERAGDSYIDPRPDSETLVSLGAEARVGAAFRQLADAKGVVKILTEEAARVRAEEENKRKLNANQSEGSKEPEAVVLEPLTMAQVAADIFSEGPEQVVGRLKRLKEGFDRVLAQPEGSQASTLRQDYRTFVAVWADMYKLRQEHRSVVEIQKILTQKYSEGGDNNFPITEADEVVSEADGLTDETGNKEEGKAVRTVTEDAKEVAVPIETDAAQERSNPSPRTRLSILGTLFVGGAASFDANLDKIEKDYASIKDKNKHNQALIDSIVAAERDIQEVIYDFYVLKDTEPDPQKCYELLQERYRQQAGWVNEERQIPPQQTETPAPVVSASRSSDVPEVVPIGHGIYARHWRKTEKNGEGGEELLVNRKDATANRPVRRERKVREEGFFGKLFRKGREIREKTVAMFDRWSESTVFSDAMLSQVAKAHLLFDRVRSSNKLSGAVGLTVMGVLAYGVSRYVSDGDGSTEWWRDLSELKLSDTGMNHSFSDLGVAAPAPSADQVLGNTYLDGAPSYAGGDVFGEGTGPTGTTQSLTGPTEVTGVDMGVSDAPFNEEDYWPPQPPAPAGEPQQGSTLVAEPGSPVYGENVSGEVVDPGIATTPEARALAHPLGTEPLLSKKGSSLWKLLAERLQDNEIFKALPLEGKNNVIANTLQQLKSMKAADLLKEYGLSTDLTLIPGQEVPTKGLNVSEFLSGAAKKYLIK